MKTVIFAMLVAGLCLSGNFANAEDATRRALAEELLNEMDMKANMEKTFAMFKKMIPSQMEKMREATEKTKKPTEASKKMSDEMSEKATKASTKMMDEMVQELSWEKIKDDYIRLYAETFTEEELQGLVAFYKSPAGRAFTKKQPELMKRSMELTQKRMFLIMPKIHAMTKEMIESPRKDAKAKEAKKSAAPSSNKQEGETKKSEEGKGE